MMNEGIVNEWAFDPAAILSSPRKVRGKFHTPMVDKDREFIKGEAIQNAVPDFMHLPILHDFHKERTVGIVTRVVELSDGSFDFEGLIKATDDCNDIWELIKSGNYDQVSIYGKRTVGSGSCGVRPEARSEPCVTTGVRLDSISVCDENARNEGTSLFIAKGGGKVVFNATEAIIKAETTDSSLMHTATDYPKQQFGKDGLPRTKKKCTATCPQHMRPDVQKGEDMDETVNSGIGQKLDALIELATQLVQKDEETKGDSFENNYKDKTQLDETEYDVDQGEEHDVRDQDHEQPGGEDLKHGEEKALTSDDELNHLAAKYHLEKKVREESQKRAFVDNSLPKRGLDAGASSVDAKAAPGTTPRDPHRPPGFEGEAGYSDASFTEAPSQTFDAPPKKRAPAVPQRQPNGPPKTTPEGEVGSKQVRSTIAPRQGGDSVESDVKPGFPKPKPNPEGEHRETKDISPGTPKRMSPEQMKNSQHNAKHGGPRAAMPSKDRSTPYQGSGSTEPINTKPTTNTDRKREARAKEGREDTNPGEYGHDNSENKADGGIEGKLDTLIDIMGRLAQSDEQVHEGMGQATPNNEEEKAISKGTEIMDDNELKLLVKAEINAALSEIKKASDAEITELKKANTEMLAKIEAMSNEVITKSGVAVVLKPGDEDVGSVFETSNIGAITKMGKAQKA
jgi:hypothetical protein